MAGMRRFNQPINCASCGRYLNTVSYFAEEKRDYSGVYCRKPECREAEAKAMRGAPENKAVTSVGLSDKTKAELYEIATERDISGRSSMTKAELIEALS